MLGRFPLPDGARYSYSQRFGVHRGTDIMAELGTPVLAVEGGVAYARTEPKGGNVVYLEGNSGRRYFYGHLATMAFIPFAAGLAPDFGGKRVQLGAELGTVGNSGNATGGPPHLHFQIRTAAKETIDPFEELLAVDTQRRGKRSSGGFGSGLGLLVVLYALSRVS